MIPKPSPPDPSNLCGKISLGETCGLRKVGQGNFDSGVISENSVDLLRYSERLQLGTIQQVSIGPREFGLHNNLQTALLSECRICIHAHVFMQLQ